MIGIGATLVVTATVVVVLLRFGGGTKAVSDNAALIGALVALGGVFTTQLVNGAISYQQRESARDSAEEQSRLTRIVEEQRAQHEALQAYLDHIGGLLRDKDQPLRRSKEGDEVRTLARARTIAVLNSLLGKQEDTDELKWIVLEFLYEARLIDKDSPIVELRKAPFFETLLNGSNLSAADLSGAWLNGAHLYRANLSGANLRGANLSDADLGDADLSGAEITKEQLARVKFLEGATMPNGQTLKSDDNLDGPTFEEWLQSQG